MAMGNTASMPVDPAILSEIKLDFQRKIKQVQEDYSIHDDLILTFDRTPLAYICASNRTMDFQGAENVPIVGKVDLLLSDIFQSILLLPRDL